MTSLDDLRVVSLVQIVHRLYGNVVCYVVDLLRQA